MSHTKAVLIACMDYRHEGKLGHAIREAAGVAHSFYLITRAGGAGVLASGLTERAAGVLFETKVALEKLGAEEVFITVHGTNEHDCKGCGGYALAGHGHHYENPEASRAFSAQELALVATTLRNEGITAPIRAFYVHFGPNGENYADEITLS